MSEQKQQIETNKIPLEYAVYDCELQHSIFGSNQILKAGCMMYETMKGVIGEEVKSIRLREKSGKVTHCIFVCLDGGLMVSVSGPIQVLPDVLTLLKNSLIMRYGCYKELKPFVDIKEEDPGKYAKLRSASLLENPTFLPIIHSISSHFNVWNYSYWKSRIVQSFNTIQTSNNCFFHKCNEIHHKTCFGK